ncbi:MAG: PTS sugar transporter subunit IIA [Nitrospirota bacterium]
MKLSDVLSLDVIETNLKAKDKDGILEEMVGLLFKAGKIEDEGKILDAVQKREELMSTGIGHGVAIPHAKYDGIKDLCAAFGRSKNGINFKSLDNEPVHLFFMLLSPEDVTGPHIKALAKISRLLKHHHVRELLKSTDTPEKTLEIIRQEEDKHL